MEKKLLKTLNLYRGLAVGEKDLCTGSMRASLLDECYSRVLRSSQLCSSPSLVCFSENPSIALAYASMPGYNGNIGIVSVNIYSDGTCSLCRNTDVMAQRLWTTEDWIYVAQKSNSLLAQNLNLQNAIIPLSTILQSGGQCTARGYASKSKIWVVSTWGHSISYDQIMTKEEVQKSLSVRAYYPSFRNINYSLDKRLIDSLKGHFNKMINNKKNWVRCTLEILDEIEKNYCTA
ncbi:MAG: hypothetical protein IKO03_03035 [Lachnospiraceae bacterium]|nr:hypothetical protein [Lachnospiraceae bacterium]MBR4608479.1 hypothetical protein [Lachnospiraceae bacterium]MBR6152467.1 hypothetical protein [Lachnospiraceae bacterium]